MSDPATGISGLAVYLPPYRVDLRAWCKWTGADWDKIRKVVGTGFRLVGPDQSVYTMAANAVLRLIRNFDVDPSRVRYLALGTESSTDNSAGAVIIKGMVDSALKAEGRAPLSRHCEVPEFKHACLGGVYAIKNALRFLATDGNDSLAIVVSADKALYSLGSSGEPTQGAGAVATLLEREPRIGILDPALSGSASDYRGVDFRKPLINRNGTGASPEFVDIPVFNGKYSTSCYMDEMQRALEDMYVRRELNPADYLRSLRAVFMHRPYHRMPETGWAMAYLFALAHGSEEDLAELRGYCRQADVNDTDLLNELRHQQRLMEFAVRDRILDEIFPLSLAVLRAFRHTHAFQEFVQNRIQLGAAAMFELGNLYTAALPAWLAAGLAEALDEGEALAGEEILLVGYGSGDAAEVMPMVIVPGWEEAVRHLDFQACLEPSVDLSFEQYLELRGERPRREFIPCEPRAEFVVDRVGQESAEAFQDAGVEYYRYVQ
jgi:hydroxymethylglutaryl-CoA synthase